MPKRAQRFEMIEAIGEGQPLIEKGARLVIRRDRIVVTAEVIHQDGDRQAGRIVPGLHGRSGHGRRMPGVRIERLGLGPLLRLGFVGLCDRLDRGRGAALRTGGGGRDDRGND